MGRDQWVGSGPKGEEVGMGAEPSAQLKGKGAGNRKRESSGVLSLK